jgi:DNA-binding IclR family transcriptional regulator
MTAFHIVSTLEGSEERATGAEERGRPTGFQAVARAAELLGMFTVEQPQMTLAEITERLEVSKPTAHRYATALRQAGLLRQSAGGYALGPRVVELASVALAGLGLIEVAAPHLERLCASTRQTAVLAVWDGEAPTVVRVHDAAAGKLVRIVVSTGSRLPLDSAQGLVFRAFLTEPEAHALEPVRRERLAYFPDVVEGIAALAAPVFQGGEITATMALVGVSAAIPANTQSGMARRLGEAAEALSLELGHGVDGGTS